MADPERLIPLDEMLADPVLVAVADAYLRTEWVSSAPPVWNSLADQMTQIERSRGRREAEQQAWRALAGAKRFVEMYRAMQQFSLKEQVRNG